MENYFKKVLTAGSKVFNLHTSTQQRSNAMNYVNNFAQAASHAAIPGSTVSVVASGLDSDATHFFAKSGEYVGTRFSDGSAITPNANGCCEFLGTFDGE